MVRWVSKARKDHHSWGLSESRLKHFSIIDSLIMGTKIDLDKFEGQGFHTWQKKVQFHLMRGDLWGIITGSKDRPKGGAKAHNWDEKDNKVFGTMALLHDDYIHYVYEFKNSQEAWHTIETQFGSVAKFLKYALLIEFFKLNQGKKYVTI